MSRSFFLILISISFLYSCRTIKEADFQPLDHNSLNNLPPLEVSLNIDSLKEKISYGKIVVSGYYNTTIKVQENFDSVSVTFIDEDIKRKNVLRDPEVYQTEAIFVPEIRIYDLMKRISKEVYGENAGLDKKFDGEIKFELLSFEEKKDIGYTIFSAWLFFTPNLLGFPTSKNKTILEIKISIFNKDNEFVKSYVANGEGSAYMAMYWGYGMDVWRKSAIRAFNNAMTSIHQKISEDEEFLKSKLIEKL